MAYATGTRIAAMLFCFTGVGIPIGLVLWHHARQKEKAAEQRTKNLDEINEKLS